MSLSKEIEALKTLSSLTKELNAKTLDRKLTDLSFYERTSQLFQPLTDSNAKVNESLKTLEEGLKQQNVMLAPRVEESKIPEVKLSPRTPLTEETGGNSWFKQHEADGAYYLAGEKSQTPRFKLVHDKIAFSKDNNDYLVDISDGLNELLFIKDFVEARIKKQDVEQYYRIYGQLGIKEGHSRRARKIHKLYPNIDREHYIKGGTGLGTESPHGSKALQSKGSPGPKALRSKGPRETSSFNTVKSIPNKLEDVKKRIHVLLASKSFGQENVNTELINLINYLSSKNG